MTCTAAVSASAPVSGCDVRRTVDGEGDTVTPADISAVTILEGLGDGE